MRRKGCRVTYFGEPKGPLRDNIDEAYRDAVRLKLGSYDEHEHFFLNAGASIEWDWVEERVAA